ncbi:MAG: hypothetical protein JST93_37385 [Acidobacteria bacterium]|nr:hypothetical protein [Acidobacteriota bacterium]
MKNRHLLFAFLCACPLSFGGVLFTEDFESYADGSILGGQNGWQDTTTGSQRMRVGNGNYLPTRVLDGRDTPVCCGGISFAAKPFSQAINPQSVTILSFDGYAVSSGTPTTNTGVYFGAAAQILNNLSVGWGTNTTGFWVFDARGATGNSQNSWETPEPIFTTYDRPGRLEVIVDGINGIVYGRYDFGGGISGQSPQYAITSQQISQLGSVAIYVDLNTPGRLGGEFDNILVEDVPEPVNLSIIGLTALLVLRLRRITV